MNHFTKVPTMATNEYTVVSCYFVVRFSQIRNIVVFQRKIGQDTIS